MDSTELTELTRKMGMDSQMDSGMAASGGIGQGVQFSISKKEKGLAGIDNSVVDC